jgi:hypothetical protein
MRLGPLPASWQAKWDEMLKDDPDAGEDGMLLLDCSFPTDIMTDIDPSSIRRSTRSS